MNQKDIKELRRALYEFKREIRQAQKYTQTDKKINSIAEKYFGAFIAKHDKTADGQA